MDLYQNLSSPITYKTLHKSQNLTSVYSSVKCVSQIWNQSTVKENKNMIFVFSTQVSIFSFHSAKEEEIHLSVRRPILLPSLCNLRRLTKVSVVNSKEEYPNV